MPITQSAKIALRKDRRRTLVNRRNKSRLKIAIDTFNDNPTQDNLKNAYSATDKAVKKNLIHKNKAARIKSSLSKKVSSDSAKPETKTTTKKNTKKTTKKTSSKKA